MQRCRGGCRGGVAVVRAAGLPGSALSLLPAGVAHLDPEQAVFEAMLAGWRVQQGSRSLARVTIDGREARVRSFAEFTNEYPWTWSAGDFEEFCVWLRTRPKPVAVSTLRGYQVQIGLFMDYVCDPRYLWGQECLDRFGTHPTPICHEWNTLRRVSDYEGDPGRRPLTAAELQALFDHADSEVARVAASGRKGALAAFRDAALLKVVYGWGLRRNEAVRGSAGALGQVQSWWSAQAPDGVLGVRLGGGGVGRVRGAGP
jgi:integrase/recombinase XerC